jgi:hypothetical protein
LVFSEKSKRTEAATQRFPTSELYENDGKTRNYTKRIGRQSSANIKGDWGHTYLKTPKSQVIANAALWKHATIKLDSMRSDLLEKAKNDLGTEYKKESAQKIIDQLSRPMTKYEKIFWAKVMYNAGQGSQAGAYDMMRKYLKLNILKDESYLTKKPTKSYGTVYDNGRHMLDSYMAAEKLDCPSNYPKPTITAFDTKTILFSESSSEPEKVKSSGAVQN